MPKPEYELFDPQKTMEWTPVEGVDKLHEIVLAKDEDSGDYTRLLRFTPGVDTTPLGQQRHDFWEEVWIVSGAIHDLGLDQTFSEGMYACRPPGMPHGPWTSPNGCVTFEIRYFKDA
jgi:hypothetical protein